MAIARTCEVTVADASLPPSPLRGERQTHRLSEATGSACVAAPVLVGGAQLRTAPSPPWTEPPRQCSITRHSASAVA
jgi:hypothetical protein